MSQICFMEMLRFLRFDNKYERSQSFGKNKFALVSRVLNTFIKNCQNSYKTSANIILDEQLLSTKARCRFSQYMLKKSDEGIRFWLASDMKRKYVVNGFPYLGKEETKPISISLGKLVVLKLVEAFNGSGRNVTTDNCFTGSSLTTKLGKKTSLHGTILTKKREQPKSAKMKKDKMKCFTTLCIE